MEPFTFLVLLMFGFGGGVVYKTEQVKKEAKIECQAQCEKSE